MAFIKTHKNSKYKRKCLLILMLLLIVTGAAFAVKPIRRVIMTYSYRLLSYFQSANIDDRPDIEFQRLSIRLVNHEDEEQQYTYVKKKRQDIHKGDLILVNVSNACSFLEDDELISLMRKKNQYYKIMQPDMKVTRKMAEALNLMMRDFEKATGKHDMLITSGYRSLQEQQEALNEKINEFGEEEALRWAMLPGYSEHHTGYAVDMTICTDDEVYVPYKGQNDYAWINKNCFKYGIVRRYTEDKIDITGVSNEPWHYRYVGIPHAYLMTLNKLCLEEYINYIRTFTFDKEHISLTTEQGSYEIYFVPASTKSETLVPVPLHKTYNISGNNIDGYIVTVY